MRSLFLFIFFTFSLQVSAQPNDFIEIDFTRAEQIASVLEGEELLNLPILVHRLTAQLDTDAERFRAIYFWVTHNVSGDYDLMNTTNRNRRKLQNDPKALQLWNNQFKKEVFSRLQNDKETLCTGYAYLIKKLSFLAGLECEIINGYDPTSTFKTNGENMANHSWNAVKLNGKWYLSDATWSSGYTDMSTFLFEFEYDNSYFLMEPSKFIKTHQPMDETWTLLD